MSQHEEAMENPNKETLERLAEASHIVWMEGKILDGWKYGTVTEKQKKIHSCLLPYNQLSEADKESDRDLVRDIPKILAAAGYKIIEIDNAEANTFRFTNCNSF
ncbi:MAG: RyR domain-containing protein [Desulfomonilaceae bacterium]